MDTQKWPGAGAVGNWRGGMQRVWDDDDGSNEWNDGDATL